MMDSAIWATWYDLPEDREEEYLSWLHEQYLPKLQSRPGYLWAAHYKSVGGGNRMDTLHEQLMRSDDAHTGTGTRYILIVGAANVLTFLAPSALDLEAEESGRNREMLGIRVGTQSFMYSELSRVNGPDVHMRTPGTTPAPAIQMGTLRVKGVENEHDIGKWYAQYRLPAIARMPGCVGARTLACIYGWPKYGVLYEFSSAEARLDNFEPHETLALDDREWTGKLRGYVVHVPGSPNVAVRIWPPIA